MDHILAAVAAELLPTILEVAGIGLAAALSWAAVEAKRRFGLDIQARHREALHSALMNGVRAALERGDTGEAALVEAVRYARASVPDAIRKLAPDGAVLLDLARAKLRDAM